MTAFVNLVTPIASPHPGVRSGAATYYTSPMILPSVTAAAAAANTAYYQPFCLPGQLIDSIGIETTVGGGNARMGLYTNLNGVPDRLIVDGGVLDVSGVAINEISLTALYLPNAWFWTCIVYSGTPTVRIGTTANSYYTGVANPATTTYRGFSAPLAYGALPAQASMSGFVIVTQAGTTIVRKS